MNIEQIEQKLKEVITSIKIRNKDRIQTQNDFNKLLILLKLHNKDLSGLSHKWFIDLIGNEYNHNISQRLSRLLNNSKVLFSDSSYYNHKTKRIQQKNNSNTTYEIVIPENTLYCSKETTNDNKNSKTEVGILLD